MGQTPIKEPNVLTNNAAKDDVVGIDGTYTFDIADLLANDPGGAAKVNVDTQFFFGNITNYDADDIFNGIPTIEAQVAYLDLHGITANLNEAGTSFVSFDIGVGATDIEYMVQIGNKGTWSQADVCVNSPPPPPVEIPHNGDLVVEWTFENHTQAAGDEVSTPEGFWNLNQWAAANPDYYPGADDVNAFAGSFQVHGVDGHRALDTAASPGNIFLQAAPMERDGVAISGGTMPDLEAGKLFHAEVSILKQDYTNVPGMTEAGTDGTDPDAWVEFNFNNTTLTVKASDIHVSNEFVTFDIVFEGVAGEDGFSIMSHGTGDDSQGLLIDNIAIHDWVLV